MNLHSKPSLLGVPPINFGHHPEAPKRFFRLTLELRGQVLGAPRNDDSDAIGSCDIPVVLWVSFLNDLMVD